MNLHPNSENLGIRTDDLELSAGSAVKRKVKLPDNLSKGIINWNKLFYCFNQLLKRKLWTWMQRQLPINPITAKFNELLFILISFFTVFYPGDMRLRPRRDVTKETNQIKNKKTTVAIRRQPIYRVPCKNVKINDVVLFKTRGFCEWPARVISVKEKQVEVEYFGDHTTQKSSKEENILSFQDSTELILFNLRKKKNPDYGKAVREAEIELGVPEKDSILTKIHLI